MNQLSYSSRCALVVHLAKKLRAKGSWCGETHLQKALYILQDITRSNFGYKYIIYKHGPYSFDLNNELAAMRSANIIEFKFSKEGYGPTIAPTAFGEKVLSVNSDNIISFEMVIDFLADWFSANDVRYLEKVATAYFVTTKNPRVSISRRAHRLHELKPHVDMAAAEEAVRIVDEKRSRFNKESSAGGRDCSSCH